MSFKIKFNTFSKSLIDKKIPKQKKSLIKNISQNNYNGLFKNNLSPFNLYSISYKNLKKYSTSKRKYNIFIINSIIFDQRIHKVAVFKNYLLWDESSEFLKRFYKNNESTQRIPKISEYYVKYTLFPPVYYGFDGSVVIIMNKWTKRKKNYLEYIEDHEDEKEENKNKNKNISFEKLINSSLINNKESSKSILSKNTLDLTKYENGSNKKCITDNFIKNNNKNFNTVNKDNSLSFSNIIDDLSSHYSIIFDGSKIKNNNINDSIIIRNKNKEKKKKITYKINFNNKNMKKGGRNEIIFNKIKNNYYYNTKSVTSKSNLNSINMTKSRNKSIESPKKSIKICLNKKNIKYMINNNNTNIIKRNNNNLPSESKKFQKKNLKTDNNVKHNEITSKGILGNKGTIRVNTITNYFTDKTKILNSNIIQRNNKSDKSIGDEIISSLKHKINLIKNRDIKKNLKYNNKNNQIGMNNVNELNNTERYSTNKTSNTLKQKNFIDIKIKSFIDNNYSSSNFYTKNQLTYRNTNNHLYYLYERPNNQNLKKHTLMNKDQNKYIATENTKGKEIKTIHKNNNKLYLEDPFSYKLTQLRKKKKATLTSTNSLSKIKNIKNITHYCTSSILDNNNNYDSNNNSNATKLIKINYNKNLVLTKLNSIKNMESKILGNGMRNNSTSLNKNNDNSLSINFKNKMSNSSSYKPKHSNPKNINLNLNLNIQFNIDIENKKKGKKIFNHNTIINQIKNKSNKSIKNIGETQNKDNNYQYPLTSRNSKRFFKDLNNPNKNKNKPF